MKRAWIILLVLVLFLGCVEESDREMAEQTEALMQEANNQLGLPNIVNFHEKKMVKMLYELRDRSDLVCHAYLFNEIKGEIGQYLGKCLGYGLPFSVQYSNPEKKISGYELMMPQAEPNGLFMPEGLSATWLMLIDPETGEAKPVYVEPSIIVSPFKLH